jgi:hypothetical protein
MGGPGKSSGMDCLVDQIPIDTLDLDGKS